ncbi:MAG: nucleoside hydrolase [Methylobacteriaceae bacterium]|jgi:purine nucleosidase|nr:nucleoside hydrolase [Methylobacteriaceae bacterium]
MTKCRIVIDTDLGVDDALAVLSALASPELEVAALTVVAGNLPLEAALSNACKMAALAGRPDLPVYAGCPGPLMRAQVYGKYAHLGAFSDSLVPPAEKSIEALHAVPFLVGEAVDAARRARPLTLCTMGPLTNVAAALRYSPEVAAGIGRIVMMGGAFTALGNCVPFAEFNVYADPHAAEIVFSSAIPLVVIPIDATFQALMTETHLAGIERVGGLPGKVAACLFRAADRSDIRRYGRPGGPVHDAMVIAYLLKPELFSTARAAVGAEITGKTMGHSWADFWGKGDREANAEIVRAIDEEGFFALLTQCFARLGNSDKTV